MKNKKKTLLMSILLVLVIGLIVTGSSFAYFQWSLGYALGTGVNVTIEHGGITMHIEPEETGFVGLYPTANCNNKHAYGDALISIEIPDSVTSIGFQAFNYSSLESVTIPASVSDIGQGVFFGCSSLKTIIFKGTMAQWDAINKDENWKGDSSIAQIICSDGEVTL